MGQIIDLWFNKGLSEPVLSLIMEDHVHLLVGAANVRAEHDVVLRVSSKVLLFKA